MADTTSPAQNGAPDWTGLADRLDNLSEEVMAAADSLADDLDNQIVQLQAVTLRHYAHHLRDLSDR